MTDACALFGVVVVGAVVLGVIVLVTRSARAAAPRHRFEYCPRCDRAVRPDEQDCPACHLNLTGGLAGRLENVRVARAEVRHLRDDGDLDHETSDRVLRRLDARRDRLIQRPAHRAAPPPLPSPHEPTPSVIPTLHPVVVPTGPAEEPPA